MATCWYSESMPAWVSPFASTATMSVPIEGAQHAASTAEQAGATDDDGGDAVEVRRPVAARIRDRDASQRRPRADRVDHGGDDVDALQDPSHVDAGQPCRLRPVAHGEEVPARRGLGEREMDDQGEADPDGHAVGDLRAEDHEPVAQHGEQSGRHRVARLLRVQAGTGGEHGEHPEGHDERRQLDAADEEAADGSACGTARAPTSSATTGSPPPTRKRAMTTEPRTAMAPAARSMPGRQDDQRLAQREDADDDRLLEDEREVLRAAGTCRSSARR